MAFAGTVAVLLLINVLGLFALIANTPSMPQRLGVSVEKYQETVAHFKAMGISEKAIDGALLHVKEDMDKVAAERQEREQLCKRLPVGDPRRPHENMCPR